MAGIILTYDIAMADSRDTGNRSMRAAGRSAWSEEDYNASVERLEYLTVVFYYANVENAVGPVEFPLACLAMQESRGMSCFKPSKRRKAA